MTGPQHEPNIPPSLGEVVAPKHERASREIDLTKREHVEGLFLQVKDVCATIHSIVANAPTANSPHARAQVAEYIASPVTSTLTDRIAAQAFHSINMLHMIVELPPEKELAALITYVEMNSHSPRETPHPELALPRETLARLAVIVHNTWVGSAPSLEGLNMQHYLFPSDSPRLSPEANTEFSSYEWNDRFEEWWSGVESLTALDVKPSESNLGHVVRSVLPVFMALEVKQLELLHRVRASLSDALDTVHRDDCAS